MPASTSTTSLRTLLVPAIALVVAAALALAAFAGGGGDDEPAAAPPGDDDTTVTAGDDEPTPSDADGPSTSPEDAGAAELEAMLAELERREDGDPLALGAVDAPVVMIEWADFQCPFCARFARDTKPALVERYVDEGLLRVEWRDLPVLGEESRTAALGGRAAARQDAFWAFHDAVYAVDRERNAGELDRDGLLALAGELDLDVDRFAEDLDDPANAAAVEEDLQVGRSLGITGTPAFLINGRPLVGGQPTEVFERAIDQVLDEDAAS